jgi:uncharacterized membrane protein YhaH (DUF805 family)
MAPTIMTYLSLIKLPSIHAADVVRIGSLMIDPRGRCNRKAMTIVTVAFLCIQMSLMAIANLIGGDAGVMFFNVFNTPLMLVGIIALVKRLHDIGLSGFWAPAAAAVWMTVAFIFTLALTLIVGPERMTTIVAEQSVLYWLLFSVLTVPTFGGLLWLHSTPGTPGSNLYGPLPGNDGYGPGHGRSRAVEMPSDAATAA